LGGGGLGFIRKKKSATLSIFDELQVQKCKPSAALETCFKTNRFLSTLAERNPHECFNAAARDNPHQRFALSLSQYAG
jgi:hypothetical protein